MKGLVTRSTGLWYQVKTSEGDLVQARLRGKMRLKELKLTNPVGVGDWVLMEQEEQSGEWLIKAIEERENYLIRESPRKKHHAHIVAANVDLSLAVVTISQPRTSNGFIDRFLLICEAYHIPAAIAFNKLDLYSDKDHAKWQLWKESYEQLGYPVFALSALKQEGLQELRHSLEGKTTVVTGHSGSGKSTLINSLAPGLNLQTKQLSGWSEKGQHTTTFAERFPLDKDTYLIDTPGIKELGIVGMEPEEVGGYFPEFRQRMGDCKFHNCTHRNEPGCAIKQAVEGGEIAAWRYSNYINIVESLLDKGF